MIRYYLHTDIRPADPHNSHKNYILLNCPKKEVSISENESLTFLLIRYVVDTLIFKLRALKK